MVTLKKVEKNGKIKNKGGDCVLTLCNVQAADGVRLYGTLHKAQFSKKPIVVIAHGYFSSNRVGPHRLYYQIASALELRGYNVVRFDLRGIGESDGYIEDVKYLDHVADLTTVLSEFRQRFNDASIILIAHCIGCNVSLPIINDHQNYFRKVIFISPYFTTPSTINAFFSQEQQKELFSDGHTYRKGIYADLSFFSGINDFSEFSKITRKHKDIISVISAANDQFISLVDINEFYKETEQTPIIIAKADHNYLERDSREELILKIIEHIEEQK